MYSNLYFSRKTSTIHSWEYNENGEKVYIKEPAPLYFYSQTDEETEYKSIFGENVKKHEFNSYSKYKDAKEMYKMANRKLYESDVDVENRYILDKWSGKDFEIPNLEIQFLDIEVHSETGFPTAEDADHPVTVITVYSCKQKRYFVFAEKDFDINFVDEDGNQVLSNKDWVGIFESEEKLLTAFIAFIRKTLPDILSGWNSNFFDIPYIVNRCYKLLGPNQTRKLSPIGVIKSKEVKLRFGKIKTVYEIAGINCIDYLELYKKYKQNQQPSYKLDYIARDEIGDTKLAYDGSIKDLYLNQWQRYVEYNIQDVSLLINLDKKLAFMNLMINVCYGCKVLFNQYEKTVKVLDGAFISSLMKDKIILPDANQNNDESGYDGAFVRPPIVGCHDWVMSYDATSLYPSIMMQHNISPETKVGKVPRQVYNIIKDIFSGKKVDAWKLELDTLDGMTCKELADKIKDDNLSIASNGTVYRHDVLGVLPRFIKEWFDKRKLHKNKKFECHEKGDDDGEKYHDGYQLNFKILINSVYGYVGTIYSRFFDADNAEAVTITGQEVIQTAMNSVNEFFSTKWENTNIGKKLNAKNFEDFVVYGDTDSVSSSSLIKINDEEKRQIDNVFDDLCDKQPQNIKIKYSDDGKSIREFIFPSNTKSPYYDENNNIIKMGNIQYIERHKVKKVLFKIKTKNGKHVEVTEDHSCMVLDNDGKLIEKKPRELCKGDKVVCIK